MSSNNYKYTQITGENALDTDKNWEGTSFWQSPLWAEILGKTHQARDIILCSGESGEILLERRTIIGKYTGLYALGADGDNITEELLEYIEAEIRKTNDLFLQIEPIDFVEVQSEFILRSRSEGKSATTENGKGKVKRRGGMRALLSTFYFLPSTFKKAPFRRFIEPVTAVLHLKPPYQGHSTLRGEHRSDSMRGEGQEEGSQGVLDEEKLFASFAEKGRYNIRLAQKRGITTRWVQASEACSAKCIEPCSLPLDMPLGISPVQSAKGGMEKETETFPLEKGGTKGGLGKEKTYLEAFYDLLEETTERDKFSHNSLSYYQHFVATLEAHDAGGLLVAEKDGILHAAGIFVFPSPLLKEGVERSETGDFQGPELNSDFTSTQDNPGKSSVFASSATRGEVSSPLPFQKDPMRSAIYYYGASSSDRDIRRDMATYLLQWEAIREGMKRGCSTYDFLGISEDGKGKLAGVTEFKLRFNPEKVHLPSEVVIIYRPMLLRLLQIVSRLRKLLR